MNEFKVHDYFNDLKNVILKLGSLKTRTEISRPIQHQYVGTAINSIILIFCSALDSLNIEHNNDKKRTVKVSDFQTWKAVVQVFQRMAFSILHCCMEQGIDDLFKENSFKPKSSAGRNYLEMLDKINVQQDEISEKELEKLKKQLNKISPSFDDRINGVFDLTGIRQKKEWRIFFKGFSILRNKSSHSNVLLTSSEQETLKSMKLGSELLSIYENGNFIIKTSIHVYLAKKILDFWDEVLLNLKNA